MDLEAYLERLASDEPTPGGGSAATIVGALGAALIAMVARITRGNNKYANVHHEADAIVALADDLRKKFVDARPADETAFGAVITAQALPRETVAQREIRRAHIQQALTVAAEAPLALCTLAVQTDELAQRAGMLGNTHLSSDVACARTFAHAAIDASVANVRINHKYLSDASIVADQTRRLEALLRDRSD